MKVATLANKNGGTSPHNTIRRAGADRHISHSHCGQSTDQYHGASRRQNGTAHMRDRTRYHGTYVHIAYPSSRGTPDNNGGTPCHN